MKPSLERLLVAYVLVATLSLPVLHAAAHFASSSPPALALSVLGASAPLAGVLLSRRATLAALAGGMLALVGLSWIRAPGALLVTVALLAVLAAGLVPSVARLLPQTLDGARRRPWLAGAWLLAGLACVAQTGRTAAFLSDATLPYGPVLPDYFEHHSCLAAYLHGTELHAGGAENLYAAEHYPGLTRDATPTTSVEGMQAYLENPYQYPPQFLLLGELALGLTNDFQTIRMVWFALSALGFAGAVLALARWVGGRRGLLARLLAPLVWASVPTMFSFQYGQFHLAALALAVGGALAMRRGRDSIGGALLAGAILSKLLPAILLVPLAIQRRWAALAWTTAWSALISLLAYVVLGPTPFEAFFAEHLPRLTSGEAFAFHAAWPEMSAELAAANQSPLGLVQKLASSGWSCPTGR